MDRRIAILALAALTIGLLAAGVSVASANEVYTIDDDTDLDDPDTIEEYESNGVVTVPVDGLNMTITITDDQRDAGVDAYSKGYRHNHIRIQYHEEIERTVRFYVPEAYVTPRVKEGVDSDTGDVVATYEPVAGGDYMAVTVQLHGGNDAALPVNTWFGGYLDGTGAVWDTVENATGVDIPRLGASEQQQWQYPPDSSLTGENATYHIPTDPDANESTGMTIQYDNNPDGEETAWMAVPDCDATVEPVCVTERDGEPVLFNADGERPPIRYKHGTDHVAETQGAVEELKDSWSGLMDRIGGLTG